MRALRKYRVVGDRLPVRVPKRGLHRLEVECLRFRLGCRKLVEGRDFRVEIREGGYWGPILIPGEM